MCDLADPVASYVTDPSPAISVAARVTFRVRYRMPLSDYEKQWCSTLIGDMMKWQLTQPFRVPVDPVRDSAETYLDVIENPMDFGTIRKKLVDGKYQKLQSFIDDLHLVCDNAILFNGEDSMFGYIASDIKQRIDDKVKGRAVSQEDEWQRRLTKVVMKLHEHIAKAPGHVATGA